MGARFQVRLNGAWKDYGDDENTLLKKNYMAGEASCSFFTRGEEYECDFQQMMQINKESGKSRQIRPPFKAKPAIPHHQPEPIAVVDGLLLDEFVQPEDAQADGRPVNMDKVGVASLAPEELCAVEEDRKPEPNEDAPAKAGPSSPRTQKKSDSQNFGISVPRGAPGTCIQVPHPKIKGKSLAVDVPANAKVGDLLTVPLDTPEGSFVSPQKTENVDQSFTEATTNEATTFLTHTSTIEHCKESWRKRNWTVGTKVAAYASLMAAVSGVAVPGAFLSDHIAEHGWEQAMSDVYDAADDVVAGAEDGVDWVTDAADTAADFLLELF